VAGQVRQAAPRFPSEDPGAIGFTTKHPYLAAEFRRRFPHPILPTLGNDDSYCGDYMIEPRAHSWRCSRPSGSRSWARTRRPSLATTSPRGGYDTIRPARLSLKGHRLVVLDSVFFSVNVNNACGQSTQTPALDQFAGWPDAGAGAHRR